MLKAGFLGTSTVMEMLEANYRTWCAQNDMTVEDGPVEKSDELAMSIDDEAPDADLDSTWNGFDDDDPTAEDHPDNDSTMEIDDPSTPDFFQDKGLDDQARQINARSNSKRKRKGKVAQLIRAKVEMVFMETELGEKRARMCTEGDFLKLLWAFNKEGIHFS